MPNISVTEFEAKVLELEGIIIRVRAPSGSQVSDYSYARKSPGNQSTSDWLEGRIKPSLDAHEVVVINGDYVTPHGLTKLDRLRKSYEKN